MDDMMAEGRMLKKLVSTSRKLANLQTDSARLLWTWILPHVDIKGRFSAEPEIIKGSVVPRLKTMTAGKIGKYLLDMASNDMIVLYKHNRDMYLEIVKFGDFQTLRDDREAESIIPPPDDAGATPGVPPDNSGLSKDKISKDKVSKSKYKDFVFLTDKEHRKLVDKFGLSGTTTRIDALNDGIGSKGYKYKSHYHTILSWERRNSGDKPKELTNTEKRERYEKETEEMLRAANSR